MSLDEIPRPVTFVVRHQRRIEIVFLVFWLAILTPSAIALLRGEPESYTGEHRGMVTVASAAIVGSLGALAKRPAAQIPLALMSMCILVVGMWQIYR
jgi:hypothetical protein